MLAAVPPSAWVVPFGDSNTVRTLWRSRLVQTGRGVGKKLNYMGSVQGVSDHHHSGYNGLTLPNAITNWSTYVAFYPAGLPHYLLCMLGTNGLPGDVANDYPTFIAAVTADRPDTRLIISSIPVQPAKQSQVDDWNAALPGIVATAQSGGHNVEYYDACAGIVDADLDDGVHLSYAEGGGQEKLAANWWTRLVTGE